jgi:hypothetical protein
MKNFLEFMLSGDPYALGISVGLSIILLIVALLIHRHWNNKWIEYSDRVIKEGMRAESSSAEALSAKDVFMDINTQYYDVILSRLTESLKRCGYTLSGDAKAATLLPARVFEEVAREVDTARLEYNTSLHYDTREDVAAHMSQGSAQVFLTQLILSCAQLGWKVTPYVSVAEGECENLSASLS